MYGISFHTDFHHTAGLFSLSTEKRVRYEFTVYDLLLDCYFQHLAYKPALSLSPSTPPPFFLLEHHKIIS